MKELFLIWISIQLIIIGIASVNTHNEVLNSEYEHCNEPTEELPLWLGAAVPLQVFVPTPQYVIDYCETLEFDDEQKDTL